VADTDADRAIFIVNAHHDDSALEPRVANAGHCQKQLAGKEARNLHPAKMLFEPICCNIATSLESVIRRTYVAAHII
jgi:hypothetical protein